MDNANEAPADAEKALFAIDLISFFWNSHFPSLSSRFNETEIADVAGQYRERVPQRFNENIRDMISLIDETQSVCVRQDFLRMKNQNNINADSLLHYNNQYKYSGSEAKKFLIYCARVALMACNFFSDGMDNALDLAADLIKSAFPDEESSSGLTWHSFETAAVADENSQMDFSGPAFTTYSSKSPADSVSSETEESSNSSAQTNESESAPELQYIAATSSADSPATEDISHGISKMDCIDYVVTENAETIAASGTMAEIIPKRSLETSSSISIAELSEDHANKNVPKSIRQGSMEISHTISIVELSEDDINKNPSTSLLKVGGIPGPVTAHNPNESSSYKSCLGKRVSPRKQAVSNPDTASAQLVLSDDLSPTKKPKFSDLEKNN